ncbi:McrB family protein [Sphingomicrobium arenosum]|uniref:McrB family protein n=1 Tax=Sphingomicrobium arenosum TaxID=2233861 RepID=UPI0022410509|nr:hypothetical protein [Sphingomicrobium arenosum]
MPDVSEDTAEQVPTATDEDAVEQVPTATEKVQDLFEGLLEKTPKGFAASSMGKFNEFRAWFAETLNLGDWKQNTYAVGSAGTAHNFSARWAQNNMIAGRHVSIGLAFLSVPAGVDPDDLARTAMNTNKTFVSGEKPTSYETIMLFIQRYGSTQLEPYSIMSRPGSPVATALSKLFPGVQLETVPWTRSKPPVLATIPAAKTETQDAKPLDPELAVELEAALATAAYRAEPGLPKRFIASLAAKPFLILAGLSGSGKTLLGMLASYWLSANSEQVAVVAVGADWTSKHHLLGYSDALDAEAFVCTPTLELLLRAVDDPANPYFLILDEMNLSHVERYFSDFLSAIESGQPLYLHGGETTRNNVPPSVPFPRNLFVIGTINVDETTYTFSPKVLDRANVIEFVVSRDALRSYLEGQRELDVDSLRGGGAHYGPSLVEFVTSPAELGALPDAEALEVLEAIDLLFAALDSSGLQLGFRSAREMIRFVVASKTLFEGEGTAKAALDAQISQRILPKLSGDAARLEPVLIALLAYCIAASKNFPPTEAEFDQTKERLSQLASNELSSDLEAAGDGFPISSEKIGRLLSRLAAHGFATAIEA